MKEWLFARWELVLWAMFCALGLLGGVLTFIHPAAVIVLLIAVVGFIVFRKMPEIFIPLYVFSGFYKSVIPGPDVTLVLFALALLAVCLHIYNDVTLVFRLFRAYGVTAMVLFLFLIVLSLVYTNSSVAAMEKGMKVLLLTGGAFFFPLFLVHTSSQYRNVLLVVVGLGTVMSFSSISSGEREVFGSTYLALGYITSLTIIILILYFFEKTKNVLIFIVVLINLLALLNSAARGPLLFMPATFLFIIALSKLKFQKKIKTYIVFVISSIVAVIGLYMAVPESFETILMRLSAIEDSENDGNVQYRKYHIEQSLELIRTRPFTGVGIGAYGISIEGLDDSRIYPHNIFLEIGAELGVPGITLFVLTVVSVTGHYFFNRGKSLPIDNTLLACMFYSFTNTLKAGNLVDNRHFFLFLGLMLTINYINKERGEER